MATGEFQRLRDHLDEVIAETRAMDARMVVMIANYGGEYLSDLQRAELTRLEQLDQVLAYMQADRDRLRRRLGINCHD